MGLCHPVGVFPLRYEQVYKHVYKEERIWHPNPNTYIQIRSRCALNGWTACCHLCFGKENDVTLYMSHCRHRPQHIYRLGAGVPKMAEPPAVTCVAKVQKGTLLQGSDGACVAVCCNELQYGTAWCIVVPCFQVFEGAKVHFALPGLWWCATTHCKTLQPSSQALVMRCNTLQHSATPYFKAPIVCSVYGWDMNESCRTVDESWHT